MPTASPTIEWVGATGGSVVKVTLPGYWSEATAVEAARGAARLGETVGALALVVDASRQPRADLGPMLQAWAGTSIERASFSPNDFLLFCRSLQKLGERPSLSRNCAVVSRSRARFASRIEASSLIGELRIRAFTK